MKNIMGWSALTVTFFLVACGGASADPFTTSVGASAGTELTTTAGSAGAPSGGAGGSTSMGGSLGVSRGGSAGAGSNAGAIGVGGSAGAASSGGTGSAGAPSMAGAGGAAAGSSGTGGGGSGGMGGAPGPGPKRVTIVGVFGGQNAQGPQNTATPGSMYYWPDGRILEWTEYESGAPLGPTSSGLGDIQGAGPVTAGAELEIGSDAHLSMPEVGTVAIVKFCRAQTLIGDWTQPESAIPWLADYEGILDDASAKLRTLYPEAQIKFAHIFINGEYDAEKGGNVDPVALTATIRTLSAKLIARFPGSFVVATEPNLALSSWWPQNDHVRAAFESVSDSSFYLVNSDVITPWNAPAHDPSFDASQELNLGSRIEYGIERLAERLWGAP